MELTNKLMKDLDVMVNRYLQVDGLVVKLYDNQCKPSTIVSISVDFEIPIHEQHGPEKRILTFLEQIKNSSINDDYRSRISKLEKLDEKIEGIHTHITTGLTEDKLISIQELKHENDKIRDNLQYSSNPTMDTIRNISKRSRKIDEILNKILEK